MPFVWIGVLLVVLKWFDVEPVVGWSWWWILAPLAVAFVWFELLEPLLGFDRRKQLDDAYAQMREERVKRQFPLWRSRAPRRAAPRE